MDVHPPKNGINRYWSIAILPFQSVHGAVSFPAPPHQEATEATSKASPAWERRESEPRRNDGKDRGKKWGEKMDKLGKMVETLGKNLENEWTWWKQENKKMEHMGKVQQNICKHEGNDVKIQQTHWNTWGRHLEILREMQWTYTIFRQLRRWMHVSCFRETYGNLSREMMETSVTQMMR